MSLHDEDSTVSLPVETQQVEDQLRCADGPTRSSQDQSGPSGSSVRPNPSSTSALDQRQGKKSTSRWHSRPPFSSTSSAASSVAPTPSPREPSPTSDSSRRNRSVRSRSIGSIDVLTKAMSLNNPSKTRVSAEPSSPFLRSQRSPSSEQGIASPHRHTSGEEASEPHYSVANGDQGVLSSDRGETRRGSAASTTSSHSSSSSIFNLTNALKSKGRQSTDGRRRSKTSPREGEETLEEWAEAKLDEGDEEGRAISEEMVKAVSTRSRSSQSSAPSLNDTQRTNSARTDAGVGGRGKIVQSLKRTRSKLGLLGKGKEDGALPTEIPPEGPIRTEEDDSRGGSVQSPVLTFVEPPSPTDSRGSRQGVERGPSNSHVDAEIGSTTTSRLNPPPSPTGSFFLRQQTHSFTSPSSSTANRIGGWFSSMLPSSTSSTHLSNPSSPASSSNHQQSPFSSPEKPRSRGRSSPTHSFNFSSPTKKSSTSTLSLPPGSASSLPPSASTSRLGPLDRMLDKAVQYFLDSDSNVDQRAEDIWILGVKHEGWRAEGENDGTAGNGVNDGSKPVGGMRRKRSWTGESGAGKKGGGKHWSPVKSRTARRQEEPRGKQYERDGATVSSRDGSPTPSTVSLSTSSGDPVVLAPYVPVSITNGWPTSFYVDFYSRPALTYRTNFAPIPCTPATSTSTSSGTMQGMFSSLTMSLGRSTRHIPKDDAGLNSDTGWGCMLRTGQSLLANALFTAHLGRDWRRSLPSSSSNVTTAQARSEEGSLEASTPSTATYARILALFLDTPAPSSPFSVHRFALEGQRLGKSVGEWFGPSTAAGAITKLVNEYEPAGIKVVSCIDGTIYENEIVAASSREKKWDTGVLVLVNLRLGIDGVNPIYYDAVKRIFEFPQSAGIAGGRPSSSYYFVGSQADSLFYIDPHHPRPAVPTVSLPADVEAAARRTPLSQNQQDWPTGSTRTPSQDDRDLIDSFYETAYADSAWRTYHCDKVRKCNLSSLDPSMLVGFLVRDERDWEDFKQRAHELGQSSTPVFSLAPSPPKWMRRSSSILPISSAKLPFNKTPSASPADDSFSEIDEPSPVSLRAEAQVDDFSEPEGWEYESTDASETNSIRSVDVGQRGLVSTVDSDDDVSPRALPSNGTSDSPPLATTSQSESPTLPSTGEPLADQNSSDRSRPLLITKDTDEGWQGIEEAA